MSLNCPLRRSQLKQIQNKIPNYATFAKHIQSYVTQEHAHTHKNTHKEKTKQQCINNFELKQEQVVLNVIGKWCGFLERNWLNKRT